MKNGTVEEALQDNILKSSVNYNNGTVQGRFFRWIPIRQGRIGGEII